MAKARAEKIIAPAFVHFEGRFSMILSKSSLTPKNRARRNMSSSISGKITHMKIIAMEYSPGSAIVVISSRLVVSILPNMDW